MNLYITNLGNHVTAADLTEIFSAHGTVKSAEIAMDGFTDQPRGFAYVEMPEEEQARAAIAALNQTEVKGCLIQVKEAPERTLHKGSYKVGNGPINQYRFKKN